MKKSAPKEPFRVLFLCTENAGRSQMAEALLRHKGRGAFQTASAGAHPAASVHPLAIEVLREQGIDWTEAVPKGLAAVVDHNWDFIITLCDRAKETCPDFPGQPVYAHWGMPDPSRVTGDAAAQRRAFDHAARELHQRIDFLLLVPTEQMEHAALAQRAVTNQRRTREGMHER